MQGENATNNSGLIGTVHSKREVSLTFLCASPEHFICMVRIVPKAVCAVTIRMKFSQSGHSRSEKVDINHTLIDYDKEI